MISDIEDSFNKDFMAEADILFLTNDALSVNYEDFLLEIYNKSHNEISFLVQVMLYSHASLTII